MTADAGSDYLTVETHWNDDTKIVFTSTGTLPAPIVAGTIYYVVNSVLTGLQIAATPGGGAIDITTAGTGVHTAKMPIAESGEVIENPAYIIEDILRTELGITAIDTDSFDVVGNPYNGKRSIWKFARSITDIDSSINILFELLYSAHCILTEDNNGNYKLVALDRDDTTLLNITQSQMSRPPLIGKTHQQYLRNQFVLKYHYNYATNAFVKNYAVDQSISTLASNSISGVFLPSISPTIYGGASGLCAFSQTEYLRTKKWIDEFLWIYDDATAEALVKRFMDWLTLQKITVDLAGWWGSTASNSQKPLILYEVGDQCKVTHPLLSPNATNNYIFMVVRKTVDKSTKTVNLNLIQMIK